MQRGVRLLTVHINRGAFCYFGMTEFIKLVNIWDSTYFVFFENLLENGFTKGNIFIFNLHSASMQFLLQMRFCYQQHSYTQHIFRFIVSLFLNRILFVVSPFLNIYIFKYLQYFLSTFYLISIQCLFMCFIYNSLSLLPWCGFSLHPFFLHFLFFCSGKGFKREWIIWINFSH